MIAPLVGLSGKKGSGKDTLADALVEQFGYVRLKFADPLREMLLKLDPIVLDGNGIVEPMGLAEYVRRVGWEDAKARVPEVRRLMQVFGTEVIRDTLGQDTWVNLAKQRIALLRSNDRPVVVTDVRFPNELEAIRDLVGLPVRILRPGPVDYVDPHPSETALDGYKFPLVLQNDGTVEDLRSHAEMVDHFAHSYLEVAF